MTDRKLPVKVQTILLDGEYKGFEFECRTNPPWGGFVNKLIELDQVDTTKPKVANDKLYELISYVATGWNYVDEKGKAIPFTREGFDKVPLDLIRLTIRKAREAIEKVPLESSDN